MVKATVQVSQDIELDVLVTHLLFQVPGAQNCEVLTLRDYLDGNMSEYLILMGDMNFSALGNEGSVWTDIIANAGMNYLKEDSQFPASSAPRTIDQIWVSDKLFGGRWLSFNLFSEKPGFDPSLRPLLSTASDHQPAFAYFLFE